MSMGVASDPVGTGEGLDGQGSPNMPNPMDQQVPTVDDNAAIEGQFGDATAPPEAAEELTFSDDDVAFLQSDEVREWIAKNQPSGLYTEEQFKQHKEQFQNSFMEQDWVRKRIDDQVSSRVQGVERQAQEQMGALEAQRQALVLALQQEWQNAGLEGDDLQQRAQQVSAWAERLVKDQKLQTYESQSQRSSTVANHAQSIYGELREWGINPSSNAAVLNEVRNHLAALQRGDYQNDQQIAQAQSALVRRVVQSQRQQAAQPQQPQQASVPPETQQAPQRPNPGPMRSVRGAGGGAGRTFEEIFDAGEQKLIQQYGDATKVPMSAWDSLHVEASMQAAR